MSDRSHECRPRRSVAASAGVFALCGVATAGMAAGQAGGAANQTAPEPVIQFTNGDITACGIAMHLSAARTLEYLTLKHAEGPLLRLRLTNAGSVTSISLRTASLDSGNLLPDPAPDGHGNLVTDGRLEPGSGALLAQELMVTGAMIVLRSGGAVETFAVPRPFPQSVRAAYLNCAGDLVRPDATQATR